MNETALLELLNKSFKTHISLRLIKPNTYQIFLPYYHPDWDMIDIFIQIFWEKIVLTDFGQTLMRLSYYADISSSWRKKLFDSILTSYKVSYNWNGILSTEVDDPNEIFAFIMEMIAVITKVSDISYLKKERIRSLFYEEFESFLMWEVKTQLKIDIKKDYSPDIDEKKQNDYPYLYLNSFL